MFDDSLVVMKDVNSNVTDLNGTDFSSLQELSNKENSKNPHSNHEPQRKYHKTIREAWFLCENPTKNNNSSKPNGGYSQKSKCNDTTLKSKPKKNFFPCYMCGQYFDQKVDYHLHMKTHKNRRTFTCSSCKNSFVFKLDLEKHMVKNEGEKSFSCKICDKVFFHKGNFGEHIANHKGNVSTENHLCEKCLNKKA
eukprot:TRINITY_DN15762_c0_g1_i1.p1 TRINITY_DN15762_c0_g1~~TRINITY_DN15762_c0_g1_i1.p1  ORF type:complete len:194 (+),score=22.00 TRINITY_DN15762_c0_g1_i1:43-624(+)